MPRSSRRARARLIGLGLPGSDVAPDEGSPGEFSDGSVAGVEVPGIQGPGDLEELVAECDRLGIPGPSRVLETKGMGGLRREEIREMVTICAERGIGLVGSIGPRAARSGGSYAASAHGGRVSCRLRGTDQLAHGLEDALRSVELGVRGLLIFDEGLLSVLSRLRGEGEIPAETRFKASIAMGCANPAHALVLEGLGASSLNPVNDLPVPALAAFRAVLGIPLDVHVDDGPETGGPDRLSELADLVAAAAPVFLKCGSGGREVAPPPAGRARRLARVLEAFEESCAGWELLGEDAAEVALPVPS